MEFRDCFSMNSTENIQEGYRNGPLKNGFRIKQLQTTIIYANYVLTSVLMCTRIANTPFNYMITAQTLLAKCGGYRFQRLIPQFPALRKKYRIASMFIITRAVSTPRDVKRRESASMF